MKEERGLILKKVQNKVEIVQQKGGKKGILQKEEEQIHANENANSEERRNVS